jgi:predicted RND superfamily exporter protein
MGELIVPGTLGILTDVAGLLVILVTTIPQMRNLGIFGAFWVAAIVFTVEILHPVLICALPPPREHRHRRPRLAVRFTEGIAYLVTHPTAKWMIAGATLVFFCAASFVTLRYSRIGDANPGVSLFWPDHPVNVATGVIGERFGGADTLVIYGEGDRPDSVGERRFLLVLEEFAPFGATRGPVEACPCHCWCAAPSSCFMAAIPSSVSFLAGRACGSS